MSILCGLPVVVACGESLISFCSVDRAALISFCSVDRGFVLVGSAVVVLCGSSLLISGRERAQEPQLSSLTAFFAHVRTSMNVKACVGSNPVAYPACVYDDRLPHGARWVVVLFI